MSQFQSIENWQHTLHAKYVLQKLPARFARHQKQYAFLEREGSTGRTVRAALQLGSEPEPFVFEARAAPKSISFAMLLKFGKNCHQKIFCHQIWNHTQFFQARWSPALMKYEIYHVLVCKIIYLLTVINWPTSF